MIQLFSFFGCCVCVIIAGYTFIRFTRCLDRCKKYIILAAHKLDKRSEQLRQDFSQSQDLNDLNMTAE